MAVIGTPILVPSTGATVCSDQLIAAPAITVVEGRQALGRRRAMEVAAGQASTIRWTMVNLNGDPVDLTTCIPPGTIKLRIRESLSLHTSNSAIEIAGSVLNASTGLVEVTLTDRAVEMPGISIGELGVVDTAGKLIFSNVFYLVVNRGEWALEVAMKGPLSIAEIRLHMRDSCPEDNIWLDVEEFDLAEIAACIERPVIYWNESQPPIDQVYNTANYPYRYNWLNGTIACLYRIAAQHYRRVHLPYSAGGVQVDDKNKAQEYQAIGDQLWNDYKGYVLQKKVQFNAEAAFQTTSSGYSGMYWNY